MASHWLAIILVGAGGLWLAVDHGGARRRVWGAIALVAVGMAVAVIGALNEGPAPVVPNAPTQAPRDQYAASNACRSCHTREHSTWSDSYHRKMTQPASPSTIVAKWEGDIPAGRLTATLLRRGDEFWVITPDLHAFMDDADQIENAKTLPKIERRIVLVTGSHHKQMYWYGNGNGHELDIFPFLWLIKDQRWVPRDAAFMRPNFWPPRRETGAWNLACIRCHTTGGRSRFADLQGSTPKSDVVDFGIACEACHGPGKTHRRNHQNPATRMLAHLGLRDADDIVNPAKLSPSRAVEVCGQCHGQSIFARDEGLWDYSNKGPAYVPGDVLSATMHVIDAREDPTTERMKRYLKANPRGLANSFWSDGMIKIGGRELNALQLAPCHTNGKGDHKLTCSHCHKMHKEYDDSRPLAAWTDDQLGEGRRGDQACTQCHKNPELAAQSHTHHAPKSPGSRCMNCHMPRASYTLLKATRNHMVSSPNAARAATTGRPDACSLCHLDKPLRWTADKLTAWYDQPRPELSDDHERIPASLVWGLSGDALQRALVTWHMGYGPAKKASGTDWLPLVLAQRVVDPYAGVRYIAGKTLQTQRGFKDMPYDFVGKIDRLNLTASAVFAKWRKAMTAAGRTGDKWLYDGRFQLRADDFDRLVKARNDAFVDLPE